MIAELYITEITFSTTVLTQELTFHNSSNLFNCWAVICLALSCSCSLGTLTSQDRNERSFISGCHCTGSLWDQTMKYIIKPQLGDTTTTAAASSSFSLVQKLCTSNDSMWKDRCICETEQAGHFVAETTAIISQWHSYCVFVLCGHWRWICLTLQWSWMTKQLTFTRESSWPQRHCKVSYCLLFVITNVKWTTWQVPAQCSLSMTSSDDKVPNRN